MAKRVLVAGATGVIGRKLLPLLLAGGHEVVAMTRRAEAATALRMLGAETVIADALDRDAVHAAVAHAGPDAVMHQLTDLSGGSTAANAALRAIGTRNLVDAALAADVPRVVAQSIAWAYEPGDDPAREDVPLDTGAPPPRQVSVAGVAALEEAVREAPEWVLLRYGMLYGPDTWYAPDGDRADQARAGKLAADADVTSFVHVDDAAAAAAAALAWPSGAVNVCDDEPAAGHGWVPVYCRAIGAGPPPVSDVVRTPWARGAANRHARQDLGWVPLHPTWRTGFTGSPTRTRTSPP
jgi:nucleoside-diphosphate-sugar epimerase